MKSAASEDEAIGIFTRLMMEKHLGYAVAQTTVTHISLSKDACPTGKKSATGKPAKTVYAVSAVMSQSREDLDTMLVNGRLPGNNADEALGRVLRDVTAKSPAFAPVSTMVTELDLTLVGCAASGLMCSQGARA